MPNTPDPLEFAKVLLWQISNMRAEIATLKLQIEDLQKALGHSQDSRTLRELELREQEIFQGIYQNACEAAKLDPTTPGQTPFGNP